MVGLAAMVSPSIPIIVNGKSLRNDANQSRYQEEVAEILRKVAASRVGRAIIDEIAGAKFTVTIEPQNGGALPELDPSRIQWADAQKTEALKQNAFILFSPGFASRAKRVLPGIAWGMFDDRSVLTHELFHAMRMVQGRLKLLPIKGPYKNREEFYGTMVENTYRSELGWHDLRPSYDNLSQAGNYLSIVGIYDDYWLELRSLIGDSCILASRIGAINCKFNPIREVLYGKYNDNKVFLSNQCGIVKPIP